MITKHFRKFKNLYSDAKNHFKEKKVYLEIPKLIDVLTFYLKAGLHPYQALELTSGKNIFSKHIRFPLCKIVILCARGCSFVESIDFVLNTHKASLKNLSLLLIGLKISFLKGAQSVKILEKIKEKSEDEIQFQRKLKVITAQMRLQANVILFSPLILSFLMMLISPGHVSIFINSLLGNYLLVLMIFLNLCGYFSLKKLMRIK